MPTHTSRNWVTHFWHCRQELYHKNVAVCATLGSVCVRLAWNQTHQDSFDWVKRSSIDEWVDADVDVTDGQYSVWDIPIIRYRIKVYYDCNEYLDIYRSSEKANRPVTRIRSWWRWFESCLSGAALCLILDHCGQPLRLLDDEWSPECARGSRWKSRGWWLRRTKSSRPNGPCSRRTQKFKSRLADAVEYSDSETAL